MDLVTFSPKNNEEGGETVQSSEVFEEDEQYSTSGAKSESDDQGNTHVPDSDKTSTTVTNHATKLETAIQDKIQLEKQVSDLQEKLKNTPNEEEFRNNEKYRKERIDNLENQIKAKERELLEKGAKIVRLKEKIERLHQKHSEKKVLMQTLNEKIISHKQNETFQYYQLKNLENQHPDTKLAAENKRLEERSNEYKSQIDKLTNENKSQIDKLTNENKSQIDKLTNENKSQIDKLTNENNNLLEYKQENTRLLWFRKVCGYFIILAIIFVNGPGYFNLLEIMVCKTTNMFLTICFVVEMLEVPQHAKEFLIKLIEKLWSQTWTRQDKNDKTIQDKNDNTIQDKNDNDKTRQ